MKHLIGVAYNAKAIAKALPKLNSSLRSLRTSSYKDVAKKI